MLCAAAHNTYIPTWQGWLYLATVIDCHTKAVIGWATDDNYKTPLIEKAIEMAARNYPLAENAIFHSDRKAPTRTAREISAVIPSPLWGVSDVTQEGFGSRRGHVL